MSEQDSASDFETIAVKDILKETSENDAGNYRIRTSYEIEEVPTEGSVDISWLIYAEPTGLVVKAGLNATLLLECMRCLASYASPVVLEIEEHYVFTRFLEETFGKEHELQADEFFETLDENGVLNLKDLVRQVLLLEAEEHPLCGRANCKIG